MTPTQYVDVLNVSALFVLSPEARDQHIAEPPGGPRRVCMSCAPWPGIPTPPPGKTTAPS